MEKICTVCQRVYKNWHRDQNRSKYCSAQCQLNVAFRFWQRVRIAEGCWYWKGRRDGNNYGTFDAGGQSYYAHRMAYMLAVGPIPAGLDILHRCDNPPCVNPDHLWPGTHTDNMRDMFEKGRRKPARGEQNGLAKLTSEQVLEIVNRAKLGEKGKYIAVDYEVTPTIISRILKGKIWQHITGRSL